MNEAVIEMTFSLIQAIQQAGGNIGEKQLEMTLKEFILFAAPNGIRFCYTPKKSQPGKEVTCLPI